MNELFSRPNGTKVSVQEAAEIAAKYIAERSASMYTVTIGTDSQNFDKTKMVEVIAIHRIGTGGIFFYRTNYVRLIQNLRQKIQEETQLSLTVASVFFDALHNNLSMLGHDLDRMHIKCQIHCDVGYNGSTRTMIQEIVGWVRSMGYDCAIKPDSYAASGIANKFSK